MNVMDLSKQERMDHIAQCVMDMVNAHIKRSIGIAWRKETAESVKSYTEYGRKRFGILSGGEYFFISRGSELLYVVDVTADSDLTAAHELMDLIARKF